MSTAIALTLVISVLFLPPMRLTSFLPLIYPDDVLVACILPWMVIVRGKSLRSLFINRYIRTLTYPFGFLLLYYTLITGLYVAVGVKSPYAMINVAGMGKPLFLACALFSLIHSSRQVKMLGAVLIASIYAQSLLMYMQQSNLLNVNSLVTPLFDVDDFSQHGLRRPTGTFRNPNVAGTVLCVLGIMSFSGALYLRKQRHRVGAGVGACLAFLSCLWLAQTRQGTVTLLAGYSIVTLYALHRRGRRLWAFAIIAAALLIGMGTFTAIAQNHYLSERFAFLLGKETIQETSSLAARINHVWPERWQIVKTQNPLTVLLGTGRLTSVGVAWDSGLLDTFEESGVPGLIGMLLVTVLPSLAAWKRARRTHTQSSYYWLYVGCTALAIPLLATSVVNVTWSAHHIMSVIVVVYVVVFAAMKTDDQACSRITLQHGRVSGRPTAQTASRR